MSYDRNSTDAMLSRIIEKLDALDRKTDRIETQTNLTNGRVGSLERWRDIVTAKVSLIALGVSGAVGVVGWLFERFIR